VPGRSLTDRNFQLSGKPCARAHSRTVSTRFCCNRISVEFFGSEKEMRDDAQWGESLCSLGNWAPRSSSPSENVCCRRCENTSRPGVDDSHELSLRSLALLVKTTNLRRALWQRCTLCGRHRRCRWYKNISTRETEKSFGLATHAEGGVTNRSMTLSEKRPV
jgi:hypothetical protein